MKGGSIQMDALAMRRMRTGKNDLREKNDNVYSLSRLESAHFLVQLKDNLERTDEQNSSTTYISPLDLFK